MKTIIKKKLPKLERHRWTKEEIKKVATLWDTQTPEEVADVLRVDVRQLKYIVVNIRKAGYVLAKKRRSGILHNLIREALNIK